MRAAPPKPRKPTAGVKPTTSESVAAHVDELQRTLERVRAAYEAYFLGIERRPPELERQQLHHRLLETQSVAIVNTALRFRFQSLMQRFTQLAGHWNRTLREIEAGTYRRDVLKAERHIAERAKLRRD
jgi:hypothetical protein